MTSKILIIGGSGLVGSTLAEYAMQKYRLHLTTNEHNPSIVNVPTTKVDLLKNSKIVMDLIRDFKPENVIHTAAFSSVDFCETHPELATTLHVDITNDIAKVCSSIGSRLTYFSTDAVFDGKLNRKYKEEDAPNPISHYGKTKLQAEKIILENSDKNIILRTTVIYGKHSRSRFTNWVLDLLKRHEIVEAYTDQHNTPTLVNDLAEIILRVIELEKGGLYHATGRTCLSRYEFALLLADKFGMDNQLIKAVTSSQKKQDAPRPVNGCLDSGKLEGFAKYQFHDITSGLEFIHNRH